MGFPIPGLVCTMCVQPYEEDFMTAEPKDRRWAFRVSSRSDNVVRQAAALSGQSITAFVEEIALARAESIIAEHRSITLSADEFARFVEALDDAPVAVPELVDLFSRPNLIPQS